MAQGYIQDLRRKLRRKRGTTQGYIQDHRWKLRRKSLDRLRAKIAEILRLINTPLADIIRDHALLRLPIASLLRFRSISVFWDHLISSPIFVDRLSAKIAEILRLINTPLTDIVRDHALPRLLVASLLRFRSVSVSWDHIISSPIFALTQYHCHRSIFGVFSSATPSRPLFEPFNPVTHALPDPSVSFLPSPMIIVRSSSNDLLCCFAPSPLRSYFICNPGRCGLCRAWHAQAVPAQARTVPCQAWSMGRTFQARHGPF